MERHNEIRSLVLGWIEGSLEPTQRDSVSRHLDACEPCRRHFAAVSRALLPQRQPAASRLQPDPYLPTRIRAMSQEKRSRRRTPVSLVLQWSLRTAAFVLAVLLGITIGEQLSTRAPKVTDHHIISEYSESFWGGGIENRLTSLAQLDEEERQ